MEDRGNREKNKNLSLTLTRLKNNGNQFYRATHFEKLSDKIEFHSKKLNIPGLQLSDYYVYPFYLNHKYPQAKNEHYSFLEQFIYSGEFARFGYKKWPI